MIKCILSHHIAKSTTSKTPPNPTTSSLNFVLSPNQNPNHPNPQAEIPADVTARALATLVKKQKENNNKYEYDSDEDVEDGTWEHKQRAAEIRSTDGKGHVII